MLSSIVAPVGYFKQSSGEVVQEPDEQARDLVRLIFEKFAELGSAYAVFRYFTVHGLRLGFRRLRGGRIGELEWRSASASRILAILRHPVYAGAYAYGLHRPGKRNLGTGEPSVVEESGQELTTRRIATKHKHGRNPLPDHLPRIEIEHDLEDAEKPCPCCGELRVRIGQEVSEQLEYLPASFKVLRHVRHKYACKKCEAEALNPQIDVAAKPPQPIAKGLPGPGLLAYVAVSKLGDHLPLYRLETIFNRQQVEIARSTMCAWLAAAGELVRPLVELMAERVRASKVIHTDDSGRP